MAGKAETYLALFPAKDTSGNRPTYSSGGIVLSDEFVAWVAQMHARREEVKVDLGLWKRKSKKGNPYLSLKLTEAWEGGNSTGVTKNDDFDDDIPF